MAFTQFNENKLIKTIDTGETLDLGGYQATSNNEFRHARILLFVNGTPGGSETLQLQLHTGTDLTAVYKSSNIVNLSDVTASQTFGWVRFDFGTATANRPNMNKSFSYRLSLKLTNYTRNADTYYLGVPYDDNDFPIYRSTSTGITSGALAAELFGFF